MKHIPAFSKEMYTGDTVKDDEDGCRSGFTEHVHMTKCSTPKAVPHMAAFYPTKSTLERTSAHGNPAHAESKNSSDDGMPEFPAPFSKKSIKGGPAHPGTPA